MDITCPVTPTLHIAYLVIAKELEIVREMRSFITFRPGAMQIQGPGHEWHQSRVCGAFQKHFKDLEFEGAYELHPREQEGDFGIRRHWWEHDVTYVARRAAEEELWELQIQTEVRDTLRRVNGLKEKRIALLQKGLEIQDRYTSPRMGYKVRRQMMIAASKSRAGGEKVINTTLRDIPLLANPEYLRQCWLATGNRAILGYICTGLNEAEAFWAY